MKTNQTKERPFKFKLRFRFRLMKTAVWVWAGMMVGLPAGSVAEDSRKKVADFMGGVLGKSGIVTGRNTGVTSDGVWVSYNGRGFATSQGYYGSSGNQTWGQDGLVVKSGQRFYGARSAWKNGNSYTDEEGESVWITTSGAKGEDEE